MIKIGITGGIGTGKSIVSHLLSIMGYPVFDTDSQAKRLMNEDISLRARLIEEFGPQTFQEVILNRAYLASVIFNDKNALQRMNSIVHPAVREYFIQWCDKARSPLVFLESAILFESGLYHLLDQVWTVSAPLDLRIRRVMLRDHITSDLVLERIHAQMSQEEKEKLASLVIHNDGNNSIIRQVEDALASVCTQFE